MNPTIQNGTTLSIVPVNSIINSNNQNMKKLLFVPFLLLSSLMIIGCGDDSKKSKTSHETIESEEIDNEANEIEEYFLSEKKSLPLNAGYGITIVDIRVVGNDVIYDAECDESLISIDALKENRSGVKEGILSALEDNNDPKTVQDVKFCKEHEVGIVYRYIGKTSRNTFEVRVSPSEL